MIVRTYKWELGRICWWHLARKTDCSESRIA